MEFYDLEKIFLYRDIVLQFFYKDFDKSKVLTEINLKQYYGLSLDEASKLLFGSRDYYWLITFFNPDLDLEKFFINKNNNPNEFITNKLDYVYKTVLGKTSYDVEEIEKVFDMFYNVDEDIKLIVPLYNTAETIERYLVNKSQSIIVGVE